VDLSTHPYPTVAIRVGSACEPGGCRIRRRPYTGGMRMPRPKKRTVLILAAFLLLAGVTVIVWKVND